MHGTPTITPRIRILAATLRAARQDAHFGLRELARRLDINPSLLAHWERGTRTPAPGDVAQILGALGIPRDRKRHILNLAHGTFDSAWITSGPPATQDHAAADAAHAVSASAVTIWSPLLIPPLMQIPDYVHAVSGDGLAKPEAQGISVTGLVERCKPAPVGSPLTTDVFVGAAALHDTVDNDETMLRQVRFLSDIAAIAPAAHVRVVPTAVGSHPGLMGAFTLFTMNDGSSVARIETFGARIHLVDDHSFYRDAVTKLGVVAMSVEESASFIETCVAERSSRVQDHAHHDVYPLGSAWTHLGSA